MKNLLYPILGATIGSVAVWLTSTQFDNFLAARWLEVNSITVKTRSASEMPILTMDRTIHRPFTATWTATIRRQEGAGFVPVCSHAGRQDYEPAAAAGYRSALLAGHAVTVAMRPAHAGTLQGLVRLADFRQQRNGARGAGGIRRLRNPPLSDRAADRGLPVADPAGHHETDVTGQSIGGAAMGMIIAWGVLPRLAITAMKDLGLIGEPKAVQKRPALLADRAEIWDRRKKDIVTFLEVFTGVGIAVGTLRAYIPELFTWWIR